ncbi:unnamed protein product [Caenorhabditis brenneri]
MSTPSKPPTPLPFADAGPSDDVAMRNKSDEPPFKLWMNMKQIDFPYTPPGKSTSVILRLHNPTATRITFKIRCTSADIFRVQPPVAFINPNGTMNITIWCSNTTQPLEKLDKRHYFAFYHKTASPNHRQAPPLWKDLKEAEGVRRIPVNFLSSTQPP